MTWWTKRPRRWTSCPSSPRPSPFGGRLPRPAAGGPAFPGWPGPPGASRQGGGACPFRSSGGLGEAEFARGVIALVVAGATPQPNPEATSPYLEVPAGGEPQLNQYRDPAG